MEANFIDDLVHVWSMLLGHSTLMYQHLKLAARTILKAFWLHFQSNYLGY